MRSSWLLGGFAFLVVFLTSCHNGKDFALTPLSDAPEAAVVAHASLEELAPAYGIASPEGGGLTFEVTVEAEDSPHLRVGEVAHVYLIPSQKSILCHLVHWLPKASAETGQALAWLHAAGVNAAKPGDFVFAQIVIAKKPDVLAVPNAALLVRDGRSFVVARKAGGADSAWSPVKVTTGIVTPEQTEIVSGLEEGAEVAVRNAIGILSPEFKAAGD